MPRSNRTRAFRACTSPAPEHFWLSGDGPVVEPSFGRMWTTRRDRQLRRPFGARTMPIRRVNEAQVSTPHRGLEQPWTTSAQRSSEQLLEISTRGDIRSGNDLPEDRSHIPGPSAARVRPSLQTILGSPTDARLADYETADSEISPHYCAQFSRLRFAGRRCRRINSTRDPRCRACRERAAVRFASKITFWSCSP